MYIYILGGTLQQPAVPTDPAVLADLHKCIPEGMHDNLIANIDNNRISAWSMVYRIFRFPYSRAGGAV